MEFFTRGGKILEASKVFNVNEAKGTANYHIAKFCHRCGGRGGSEAWAHTGFTCYQCGGSGGRHVVNGKAYSAEKLAKLDAIAAKATAKRDAKKVEADAQRQLEWLAVVQDRAAAFEAEHVMFLRELKANRGVDSFLDQMIAAFEQYGRLTERQLEAAQNALGRVLAARSSEYVNAAVGERVEMVLTCHKRIDLTDRNQYPVFYRYIHNCTDAAGHVVVYIGSAACMPGEGETATVRAKIKEFSVYRGVKQTKIERPTAAKAPELAAA